MRNGCGADGFTLLELIAVIVIVGLLAAFAPLILDSVVVERELEAEVARLGDTIEILLRQAVLDGVPYAIHYDTQGDRYALSSWSHGGGPESSERRVNIPAAL